MAFAGGGAIAWGLAAAPATSGIARWPIWVLAVVAVIGFYVLLAPLLRWWPWLGRNALNSPSESGPSHRGPPIAPASSADSTPNILKAKQTTDGNFPRIESAVDSLGHKAERGWASAGLSAHTQDVVRPGQRVTFEIEASDPNGDDLVLRVITPGRNADVALNGGVVTWNVSDADIGDPTYVHIYIESQRTYHSHETYDDAASFSYRVLPRL